MGKIFSRAETGELLLCGFHIFGGWLPFLGWRVRPCDRDGMPMLPDERGNTEAPAAWLGDTFEIEWLGLGIMLAVGNLRPLPAEATEDRR